MKDKELGKQIEVFDGYSTIKELKNSCKAVPTGKGIYVVFRESYENPEFLTKGTGGLHKGKDLNYPVEELVEKWVYKEQIIYIGKTDQSLRKRISAFMKYGSGYDVAHRGGRAIWQLSDSADFIVAWKVLPENVSAREIEFQLIQEFKSQHLGKHPFANWVD